MQSVQIYRYTNILNGANFLELQFFLKLLNLWLPGLRVDIFKVKSSHCFFTFKAKVPNYTNGGTF